MAIDFNQPQAANTTNTGAAPAARPQAKLWLNVGVTMPFTQADGTVEDVFVSLPIGIALDTMTPMKGNSSLAKRKNALLSKLQGLCLSVDQGGSQDLNGMKMVLTRASDTAAQVSDEDQAAIDSVQLTLG